MMSPTATLLVSDAVLVKAASGAASSTVTVSSSVTGVYVPRAGTALAVAIFVISVVASISACKTVYVAVKLWVSPGSRSTFAGVIAESVPAPECTSEIDTLVIVTLPVFSTRYV